MTVYVDRAHIPATVPNGGRSITSTWCHLTADSSEELLEFASRLGLKAEWLQRDGRPGEHFDVTAGKRRLAVSLGAVEITSRESVAQMRAQRAGEPFDLAALRAEGATGNPQKPTIRSGSRSSMPTCRIWVGYQDTTSDRREVRLWRWTESAVGHTWWPYDVQIDGLPSIETIAEAVSVADNSPHSLPFGSLEAKIRDAMLTAYRLTTDRHHSLSVGDRVRTGEHEVVCTKHGWRRIRPMPQSQREEDG